MFFFRVFVHRIILNEKRNCFWKQTSVFTKAFDGLKLLTDYAKTVHFRCLKGFWIRLYWKTRQVQDVQKELPTPLRKLYIYVIIFWNISMILANVRILEANSEAYSELCQMPKMEHFANIVNGVSFLTIFFRKTHLRCLARF